MSWGIAPRHLGVHLAATLTSAVPEMETTVHATVVTACTQGDGACHPSASVPCSPAQQSGQLTGGGWADIQGKG